ncbi:MAG: class I mannose-6-phosphate isomerase [Muribaculaceae bacterium]|nr:class I mannose-6-phosphate isomerase [Muribaculaceae bacterium]
MFQFHPILKSVLWGGDRLAAYKGLDTDQCQIGESWEISGMEGRESVVASGPEAGRTLIELIAKYRDRLVGAGVYARYGNEFPLLVKLIDAGSDLSLQVHPDDSTAARRHGCPGKTEMWYIIDADPGACILAGFDREVDATQFERIARDGSLLHAVRHYPSHAGDAFFLPPGTIHSIGAGNLLAEIQQSSDITYRVYDYNRRDAMGNQRELHTAQAREVLDFGCHGQHVLHASRHPLAACPHFVVDHCTVDGTRNLPTAGIDSFVVLLCLSGDLTVTCAQPLAEGLGTAALRQGQSLLIPACATRLRLVGHARLLAAWMPKSEK